MNQSPTVPLIVAVLLTLATPTWLPAQPLDFQEMSPVDPDNLSRPNLADERTSLWSGNAKDLQFEVAYTGDVLVWVSATSRNLHVGTGREIALMAGEPIRIPGRVLALNVNDMPHLRNRILISVTYWSQNRLVSDLFSYHVRSGQLQRYHRVNSAALRPVGDFLYGQSFDPNRGWSTDIFQLTTKDGSFGWDNGLQTPGGTRLLHMVHLPYDQTGYINDEGSFVVSRNVRVKRMLKGSFGAVGRFYGESPPREQTHRRFVRIPPAFNKENNLIVLVNNRTPGGQLDNVLSSGEQTGLTILRWNEGRIRNRFRLGPLDGRILDVEMPKFNSDQLLWLRRTRSSSISLEMLDLSEQDLR